MLSVGEFRALAADRQWQALVERASPLMAEDRLVEEPEIAFLYADGLWRLGRSLESVDVAERIESRIRRDGNRHLILNLLNTTGMALFEAGRIEQAEEQFGEVLELATEWKDEEFAARASNNLGVIANVRGRRDLALVCYQRALASYQRLGYVRGLAQTHHNLGISYRDLGFDREADTHYQRAIGFATEAGSDDVIALAETERALLRARSGDGSFAETLARRALQRFEAMGDPLGRAEALRVLAAAARASDDDRLAAERLDEALSIARSHADSLLHAEVQRDRGLLLRDQGDATAASDALRDAAEHFATIGAAAEAEAVRALDSELAAEPS